MKTNRTFVPQDSMYPFRGLNTLDPSTMADPRFSPNCLNVFSDKGIISKRRGYRNLGQILGEKILALPTYESETGLLTCFAITPTKQYKYDNSTGLWDDVTETETIWSGGEDVWVDYCEGTDDNGHYLFITNNSDSVIYWDGSDMKVFTPTSGLDDFVTCRTLTTYLGCLVLGNLNIDETMYPHSVAYSAPANFFDFSSVGADIVLLDGIQGSIERIVTFGGAIAIYGTGSIGVARFVEGAAGYVFDNIISRETRILGGRGVINLGQYNALVMQDNVYLFDGTKNLIPIANEIFRTYVGSLELDQIETAFAFNDTFNKRAYFVLPISTGTIIFTLDYEDFTLDVDKRHWSVFALNDTPTCFGFFSEDKSITYETLNEMGTTYYALIATYKELFASPGFPFTVFGSDEGVFTFDKRTHQDNGVDVLGSWETIDFTVPRDYGGVFPKPFLSSNGRWIELEIELFGIDASLYYSVDRGITWILIETLDLKGLTKKYTLNLDVVAPQLRIKISSTTYFTLPSWLRLWVTEAGVSDRSLDSIVVTNGYGQGGYGTGEYKG